MKNIKNIVFIVILLILNGVLIYKLKSYSNAVNGIGPVLNKYEQNLLTFEQNFVREKENENLTLDENTKFLDIEGNLVLAKDLFKTKKIVLRYSESNCKDCINSEINALLKNNNELKEHIILIAYYKNKRDLFVYHKEFKKKGLGNIEMYLLPENGLNISIETLNMPFYFCVNSNLVMNNFFIPQKDKPKLSESYLRITPTNFIN